MQQALGSRMELRSAFSGKQLAATSKQTSRTAPAAQVPVQARAAATQRLKTLPKKKVPAKKTAPPKTGTQRIFSGGAAGGTQKIGTQLRPKKLISIANNSKEKAFRQRQADSKPAPKLLARVEQLRLLSKLEELKLLSLLERNGVTLTFIEESGLLETAESLGLLSAASDRNTPNLLFTLAFALYAIAPAAVYFLPDDSTSMIALQAAIVAIAALGGTAAYAGGSLLATLQKDLA